jgi:hypothetical protein
LNISLFIHPLSLAATPHSFGTDSTLVAGSLLYGYISIGGVKILSAEKVNITIMFAFATALSYFIHIFGSFGSYDLIQFGTHLEKSLVSIKITSRVV